MPKPRIITFTTDFGDHDTYVGQMKGAILAIHPESILVDLTHHVPPGDVEVGAFLLETSWGVFPQGTIHVAVVDPEVGTDRRAVVALAGGHVFLAPDNGLLARVLSPTRRVVPGCSRQRTTGARRSRRRSRAGTSSHRRRRGSPEGATPRTSGYPVEVGIWQTLGDAYMRANRLKEALNAYNKAEELIR